MSTWTVQTLRTSVVLLAAISPVWAYDYATTHVGALDYIEGRAFVNGKLTRGNTDQLPILDSGDSLRTGKGHAEMLLTPGVYLRLGGNSKVHLLSASLTDTRLRLEQGAAILEVDDLHKDNLIRADVGPGTVQVLKDGLYRFDASPARVQVLKGKVALIQGDIRLKAGKHREIVLSPGPMVAKFKPGTADDLSRWSRLRSEYEAEASVASAQYIFDMGWPWGFSDWFWNPWFSTWTWIPAWGPCINPYGFAYFSPVAVYQYYPARYYGAPRFSFVPRSGAVSPSGLNLQRGPGLGAARMDRPLSPRFGWGAGSPAMRAPAGHMEMGRSMAAPSMGRRR